MISKSKTCEWLGHRFESTGPTRDDYPSEQFICSRCGTNHSVNEWADPLPKPKIRLVGLFALIALGVGLACYVPTVVRDVQTYQAVVDEHHGCCGFVSESWFERPVTYTLVDEWSKPAWSENSTKTERWLISMGQIDGESKFWRILERQPLTEGGE